MKYIKIGQEEYTELKQNVSEAADQLKLAGTESKTQKTKIAELEGTVEAITVKYNESQEKIANIEKKAEIELLVQKAIDKGMITQEKKAEKVASLMGMELSTEKIAQVVADMNGGDHGDGKLISDLTEISKVASKEEKPDSVVSKTGHLEKQIEVFSQHNK